jgi:hypothetical protein
MPLWLTDEGDYEAILPGKFLGDEDGCKICHCRLHRGTLLGRKCNIYANKIKTYRNIINSERSLPTDNSKSE